MGDARRATALKPRPPPKRRPVLAVFMVLAALLLGADAALSSSHFSHDLVEGARYVYPSLAPPMQAGVGCVLLMNAALWSFPRLQAVRQGWLFALAAISLGLVYGAGPAVGKVLLLRALRGHGYTECRPMGWIDRGLWVSPGHACP